jgi:uncharacterized membrane protein
MLYPAELRARGYMVFFQQFNAVSSAISTSSVSAFASHLIQNDLAKTVFIFKHLASRQMLYPTEL